MNFFAIFLEFSLTRQFGTKRNVNFFFLSLSLFHPILAWNEATIVFFDFFEFSSLFLEFSITCLIRRERKDNFYFFSFSAFSYQFWHEMKPQWYFFIFLFFLSFFGILYFPSGTNETERQFLFSLFLLRFQPILAWKEAIMGFFFIFYFTILFLLFFFNYLLCIG